MFVLLLLFCLSEQIHLFRIYILLYPFDYWYFNRIAFFYLFFFFFVKVEKKTDMKQWQILLQAIRVALLN